MHTDGQPNIDFRDRITVNPSILFGKPTIRGTRFPVSKILNLVGHGMPFDEILDDYPILAKEDIYAAILYAAASFEEQDIYAFSYRG